MEVIARAFALAALLALPLQAGAAGQGEAADAPAAEILHFESVFDGYAPYVHQPVAPWRQSNDRVGEIGGWRSYAREAAQGCAAGRMLARTLAASTVGNWPRESCGPSPVAH